MNLFKNSHIITLLAAEIFESPPSSSAVTVHGALFASSVAPPSRPEPERVCIFKITLAGTLTRENVSRSDDTS